MPAVHSANARWKARHPDKVREAHHRWCADNRLARRSSNKKWRDANAEALRMKRVERHDRLKRQFESGERARAKEKRCSLCKTLKPASDFYLSNNNTSGLHGWCKKCSDRKTTENARKRLGVDARMYARLLEEQDGCCAICRSADPGGKSEFALDHDHATGRVRGVLCHPCNAMLGMASDNIPTLRAAIHYLEVAKACVPT